MLKVNRKVEYGLVALKYMMAKPDHQLTSVREICDVFNTPFDPVAHVLRLLNGVGVLQSEQGAHGGYRLVGDLTQITLASFIKVIEGHLSWTDCNRAEEDCKCGITQTCNIVGPMYAFNEKLTAFLEGLTIAELLAENAEWGYSDLPSVGNGRIFARA